MSVPNLVALKATKLDADRYIQTTPLTFNIFLKCLYLTIR
jgi:hypothetical protein